jgi:hypothetical protein
VDLHRRRLRATSVEERSVTARTVRCGLVAARFSSAHPTLAPLLLL